MGISLFIEPGLWLRGRFLLVLLLIFTFLHEMDVEKRQTIQDSCTQEMK